METAAHPLFEMHREYARRVAISIVSRIRGEAPSDSVLQDALVGLFKATLRFDPHHRTDRPGSPAARFTTFAFPFIAGAVRNGLRERRPHAREILRELATQEGEDLWLSGVDPEAPDPQCAAASMLQGLGIVRLVAPRDLEFDGDDPVALAHRNDLRSQIAESCRRLPRRQRLVLRLLFGRSFGVTTIATMLKVDKAQIARDFQKAITTLRFSLCPELAGEKPARLAPQSR